MNMLKHDSRHRYLGALLTSLLACTPITLDPLDLGGNENTGGGETGGGGDETDGATTSPCEQPVLDCALDLDRDGKIATCDNAPAHANPDQSDIDMDGFGDVIDLCPTLPSDANDADEDGDGIGDACDLCGQLAAKYNDGGAALPAYMRVRNIPDVGDADRDGIGDACDNCVRTPNCQSYGDGQGQTPYELGMPIDPDAGDCQVDEDKTGVGDACAGTMLPGAAGPVGLQPEDDFDQDGLKNVEDGCPRQPVAAQMCDGPEDCPDAAQCTGGVCNHSDHDQDGVGDACDSCPFAANPLQIVEGQDINDDPDGDFVGNACEGAPQCFDRPDPRRLGFYDSNVEGICCVKLLAGPLLDPDGVEVEAPPKVQATPGLGLLPPGCAGEAQPVTLADVGGDPAALWPFVCLLPQTDQDFDGVPDLCDLCQHTFDPGQETNDGLYGTFCTGQYDPSELDPTMMCLPGT